MMRPLVYALLLLALVSCHAAADDIPVYRYKVVHAYPHDTHAFTEGLFYWNGYLYESTGEPGQSSVRKVQLETGKVLQKHDLPGQYFGEGIINWDDRLVQLTWRSQLGFVYDFKTFATQHLFFYSGEGWALTRDDEHIYMSDGTPTIRVLDPQTLAPAGSIEVTADGQPLSNINELEWVDGQIFANVWMTNRIARIDPKSGAVVGWIDLSGLLDTDALPNPQDDVLNGIAYDAAHKRLFVTGKNWPKLFEIKLLPPSH